MSTYHPVCRRYFLSLLLALAVAAGFVARAQASPIVDTYTFENGVANTAVTTVVDSTGTTNGSVITSSPTYSTNVPGPTVPQTGQADTLSAYFAGYTYATEFNSQFLFDTSTNATLEFYFDPIGSVTGEHDIFWTTTGSTDANRYNIGYWNGQFFADYRDPSGNLHPLFATQNNNMFGTITLNQWNFVALVKQGSTYTAYVNGATSAAFVDQNSNLPTSAAWTINGRYLESGIGSYAASTTYLDNVLITNQALAPAQFLTSAPLPEPVPIALCAGMLALALVRRRTPRT